MIYPHVCHHMYTHVRVYVYVYADTDIDIDLSYLDLEPRQGEPTQTDRDHWGPVGAVRGLLGTVEAYLAFSGCPGSVGRLIGNIGI